MNDENVLLKIAKERAGGLERLNVEALTLDSLHSTEETAVLLAADLPTLRALLDAKAIEPICIGERRGHDGLIFTDRMVNEYLSGKRPVKATIAERRQIKSVKEAAGILDVTENAVKQAYFVRKTLPGKTIGGYTVFLFTDLRTYRSRKPASGAKHPRALFSEEQVREMRKLNEEEGLNATQIIETMNLTADLSTVFGVLTRRTYKKVS
jgi:hypothetical protein